MMKMTDRELDALVAEKVMGWIIGYPLADAPDGMPPRPPGDTRSHYDYPVLVPAYSTDIAAAWQVEERIAELGLIDEYCLHLNAIANAHWEGGERRPQRWQLIHALPEDRCRAALKAVEVENDG